MVQMILCSWPRWSMMEVLEACVLGKRLAVWGNWEEAEKPGRGWKGQANLKEEKGEGNNGGRRDGGRQSRGKNWVGGFPQQSSASAKVFSQLCRATAWCWPVQTTMPCMECSNHGSGWHWPHTSLGDVCLLPGKGVRATWAVNRLQFGGTALAGSSGFHISCLDREHVVVGQWQWNNSVSGWLMNNKSVNTKGECDPSACSVPLSESKWTCCHKQNGNPVFWLIIKFPTLVCYTSDIK